MQKVNILQTLHLPIFCQDMETDFDQMALLQKDFPKRITFLRFEDFLTLPKRELLEISEFLGLPSTEEMENYVGKKLDSTGQLLAHNFDTSSNAWQSQMHFTTIERIQKIVKLLCQNGVTKYSNMKMCIQTELYYH